MAREISEETRRKLSEAGKKGVMAQPREAKAKGGRASRGGGRRSSM